MTGIEILAEEIIYNSILPEWIAYSMAVVGAVCGLLGLIFCVGDGKAALISGAIALVLFIGAFIGLTEDKDNINYIKYKVTISEEVSLTEFVGKYEILEEDGKIYTIRERNDD